MPRRQGFAIGAARLDLPTIQRRTLAAQVDLRMQERSARDFCHARATRHPTGRLSEIVRSREKREGDWMLRIGNQMRKAACRA